MLSNDGTLVSVSKILDETDGNGNSEDDRNMRVQWQHGDCAGSSSPDHLDSDDYFNEVRYSLAAQLASPRPSLPNISIHSMSPNFLANAEQQESAEAALLTPLSNPPLATLDASAEQKKTQWESDEVDSLPVTKRIPVRSQCGLLKKPKLFLRSYSTPNANSDSEVRSSCRESI